VQQKFSKTFANSFEGICGKAGAGAALPPKRLALACASHNGAAIHVEAVRAWLAWCASPATAEIKRRNGMEAA